MATSVVISRSLVVVVTRTTRFRRFLERDSLVLRSSFLSSFLSKGATIFVHCMVSLISFLFVCYCGVFSRLRIKPKVPSGD
jgi:hypothetical protein